MKSPRTPLVLTMCLMHAPGVGCMFACSCCLTISKGILTTPVVCARTEARKGGVGERRGRTPAEPPGRTGRRAAEPRPTISATTAEALCATGAISLGMRVSSAFFESSYVAKNTAPGGRQEAGGVRLASGTPGARRRSLARGAAEAWRVPRGGMRAGHGRPPAEGAGQAVGVDGIELHDEHMQSRSHPLPLSQPPLPLHLSCGAQVRMLAIYDAA